MTAAITVLKIRALDGKSAVRAFVDIQLGATAAPGTPSRAQATGI
jgi:hypothetical protein